MQSHFYFPHIPISRIHELYVAEPENTNALYYKLLSIHHSKQYPSQQHAVSHNLLMPFFNIRLRQNGVEDDQSVSSTAKHLFTTYFEEHMLSALLANACAFRFGVDRNVLSHSGSIKLVSIGSLKMKSLHLTSKSAVSVVVEEESLDANIVCIQINNLAGEFHPYKFYLKRPSEFRSFLSAECTSAKFQSAKLTLRFVSTDGVLYRCERVLFHAGMTDFCFGFSTDNLEMREWLSFGGTAIKRTFELALSNALAACDVVQNARVSFAL